MQSHMVHGKVMGQDVELREEEKEPVDGGKGVGVTEDRVGLVALDEDRETAGEKDEGA